MMMKRGGGAETGDLGSNPDPIGQRKMYLCGYEVMKIKTVKPEKAVGIENSIINAARNGMLKNRVTEAELVNLLEKDSLSRGEQKVTVLVELSSSKGGVLMISGELGFVYHYNYRDHLDLFFL